MGGGGWRGLPELQPAAEAEEAAPAAHTTTTAVAAQVGMERRAHAAARGRRLTLGARCTAAAEGAAPAAHTIAAMAEQVELKRGAPEAAWAAALERARGAFGPEDTSLSLFFLKVCG